MPNPPYTALQQTKKTLLITWLLIALIAYTDAWWMYRDHIYLSVKPVLDAIFVLGGANAVFLYGYAQATKEKGKISIAFSRQRKHLDNAWFMAQLANQFAWGGLAIMTLSYVGLTLNRPFIDAQLLAADTLMGFNWYGYLDWLKAHPFAAVLLRYSYHSMLAEMALLMVLLGFIRQYAQAQRYVMLFLSTAFLCVAISVWWPSLGIPEYLHFNSATHYADLKIAGIEVIFRDILYMRSHGHNLPDEMNGLITFPSFHAAFAIVAIDAVKYIKQRIVRYPIIALNVLMILSTPAYGWHYLSDVIGGIAVALVCIAAITRLMPKASEGSSLC